MSNISNMLEFLELVGELKRIKRTGWVDLKLQDTETVSGHMYRMAMMTFLIGKNENLDQLKCLQLSLVHDLAECIVGDLTPNSGISNDQKHKFEFEAMEKICGLVGERGDEIFTLFKEYEDRQSPEAKFVKELDALDMFLQAYEYEKRDNIAGKLEMFFESARSKFNHPLVLSLVQEIDKRRNVLKNLSSPELN